MRVWTATWTDVGLAAICKRRRSESDTRLRVPSKPLAVRSWPFEGPANEPYASPLVSADGDTSSLRYLGMVGANAPLALRSGGLVSLRSELRELAGEAAWPVCIWRVCSAWSFSRSMVSSSSVGRDEPSAAEGVCVGVDSRILCSIFSYNFRETELPESASKTGTRKGSTALLL